MALSSAPAAQNVLSHPAICQIPAPAYHLGAQCKVPLWGKCSRAPQDNSTSSCSPYSTYTSVPRNLEEARRGGSSKAGGWRAAMPRGSVLGTHHLVSHLSDVKVDVEALSISLHLPHPHLAGQVAGAGVDALQGEGAVQILLSAIPDVVKRDLLWRGTKRRHQVCPAPAPGALWSWARVSPGS